MMWIICRSVITRCSGPPYSGMKFSTDHAQIEQWAPLVMEGRDPRRKVAAAWTPVGTEFD